MNYYHCRCYNVIFQCNIGNYEFDVDMSLLRVNAPYGFSDGERFNAYLYDRQGNVARVIRSDYASVTQTNSYYPYGLPTQFTNGEGGGNRYRYGGKELTTLKGLNLYDFAARTYAPDLGRFMQPDPSTHDYHWLSPYAYCGGDPVNFVDPTGCSTWVIKQSDGTYKVVGGNLDDNDLNIYEVYFEGGNMILGCPIGVTPVITSFYNSDNDEWATDSYIDPKDLSGMNFLNNMTGDNTPGLFDYISKAGTDGQYDFKMTNGTPSKIEGLDIYRGMPIGKADNGLTMYTSARDIGNMVAGYVATANYLSWIDMRLGFDAYQIYKYWEKNKKIKFQPEGASSQNAQLYGRALKLTGTR